MARPTLKRRGGEVVTGRTAIFCIIFNSVPVARRSPGARNIPISCI